MKPSVSHSVHDLVILFFQVVVDSCLGLLHPFPTFLRVFDFLVHSIENRLDQNVDPSLSLTYHF